MSGVPGVCRDDAARAVDVELDGLRQGLISRSVPRANGELYMLPEFDRSWHPDDSADATTSVGIWGQLSCRKAPRWCAQRCCLLRCMSSLLAPFGPHAMSGSRIFAPSGQLLTHLRPLLPQHDGAARVVAHDVERVLADIDTDYGDRAVEIVGHGVLLVFGAPCQIRRWQGRSTAGPSH